MPSPIKPAVAPTGQAMKSGPEPGERFRYPVPAAKRQPKYLFHFIIRYEGQGVIDSSVVALFKMLNGDGTQQPQSAPALAPAPMVVPPPTGSAPPNASPAPPAANAVPANSAAPATKK